MIGSLLGLVVLALIIWLIVYLIQRARQSRAEQSVSVEAAGGTPRSPSLKRHKRLSKLYFKKIFEKVKHAKDNMVGAP